MSFQDASVFVGRATSVPSIPQPQTSPRSFGLWAILGWMLVPVAALIVQINLPEIALALWDSGYLSSGITSAEAAGAARAICFCLMLALLAGACRHPHWSVPSRLGLQRPHGRYILLGVATFLVMWTLMFSLALLGSSPGGPVSAPPTLLALVLHVFALSVIAPAYEEMVYRGLVYRGLAGTGLGIAGAIVVTALIWALLHFDKSWIGITVTFIYGLALGILRWRTHSTWVTIAVHATQNSIVSAALAHAYFAQPG
jgi:membrane protease YdiL (CAAX protease family)